MDDARVRGPVGIGKSPVGSRAALATVVGARYLTIGAGDTALYVFTGVRAAVVLSVRVFLVRGAFRHLPGAFVQPFTMPVHTTFW